MNEKRFKLSKPNGAYLIDNDRPYAHWINDDDKIVDLLNSLNDENEQLKKELKSFKPIIFESDGKSVTLYEKRGDVE